VKMRYPFISLALLIALAGATNASVQKDSLKVLLEKGGSEMKTNKLIEAEASFTSALRFDSTNLNALKNLGVIGVMREKYDQSIHFLRRAIAFGVADGDIYNLLGAAYAGRKELEPSLAAYTQALGRDSTNLDFRRNRAIALVHAGKFAEALPELGKVLAKRPDDGEIIYLMGDCYSGQQDAKNAVASYKLALDKKYNTVDFHYHYSIALVALGDIWSAEEQYGAAVRLAPDNLSVRQEMAVFYVMTSNFKQAVELFEENLRRDTTFVTSRIGLGAAYAYMGLNDKAQAELAKVRASNPDKVNMMKSMMVEGEAYRKNTDSAAAANKTTPPKKTDQGSKP